MKVLVEKVNCGVVFSIQNKPNRSESAKLRELLRKAVRLYADDVSSVAALNNVSTTAFFRAVDNATYTQRGVIIQFEVWGFASGTFENPEMADTGSVATDGRAKFLLAVQAPLNKTKDEKENAWVLSKEYIV